MNELTLTINALVAFTTLFLLYALLGEILARRQPVTVPVPSVTRKQRALSARGLSALVQRKQPNNAGCN